MHQYVTLCRCLSMLSLPTPCPSPPPLQTFTQVNLILLLFGTLCGGLAFLSDVARVMVQKSFPDAIPCLSQDGRLTMVAVVLLVLVPLCLQRHIRQVRGGVGVEGGCHHDTYSRCAGR